MAKLSPVRFEGVVDAIEAFAAGGTWRLRWQRRPIYRIEVCSAAYAVGGDAPRRSHLPVCAPYT